MKNLTRNGEAAGSAGSAAAASTGEFTTLTEGTLTFAVSPDYPPFENLENGEYVGLDMDLGRAIAAELGLECEYTNIDFDGIIPAIVAGGQADAGLSGISITPEREEDWDFSTPYRTDSVGIMVKKANGWTSMEDLDGQTIGVSTGSTTQQLVEQMIADEGFACTPAFQEYQSYPEIKDALDAGMVGAFAMDRSTLNTYMDDTVELLQPEVEFGTQEYGVATEKGSDLSELVDETVVELLDNGWIDEDIETWLGASA